MILSRRAVLPLVLLPRLARADAFDLSTLMARLASVPERRATFREERVLAALTVPLVSTGTLFYRRPDYLEKNTLWPQPERMTVEGSRLVIADPASNDPPHVVPLDAQPGLRTTVDAVRAPLSGDAATLRRAFAATVGGSPAAWTLDLVPTEPAAAALIRAIHVAGQDSWIATLAIEQANGDRSTMQIAPA